jgi:hypothetical protein
MRPDIFIQEMIDDIDEAILIYDAKVRTLDNHLHNKI